MNLGGGGGGNLSQQALVDAVPFQQCVCQRENVLVGVDFFGSNMGLKSYRQSSPLKW